MTSQGRRRKGWRAAGAVAALCLVPLQGGAMVPPPPCDNVSEANMWIRDPTFFGDWDAQTGVVIEGYSNKTHVVDTVYRNMPAPVPALQGFIGTRITFCDSGRILAVRDVDPDEAFPALSATEFLRDKLKANRKISYGDVMAAVTAVYGRPVELKETAQTCGCAAYFDDMRPKSQTPFPERQDVGTW
ncbi:MAG: hypothetical protein KDK24_13415 [Pseudooceanicola sp.]|nr:hypothetical protein [Pseudooceanicola sp.]